jgi:hypothetical protein
MHYTGKKKKIPTFSGLGKGATFYGTLKSDLKVHKRENFLGFDFKICTFS